MIAGALVMASMGEPSPVGVPGDWKLSFRDEFNGRSLNRKVWTDQYHFGRKHNTENYYGPDQFQVVEGCLVIRADRKAVEGYEYVSGVVTSLGSFVQTYGVFEIKARLPKGRGYWPALWMIPASKGWPPEIDIMEFLGHEPDKVYMTAHWKDEKGERRIFGRPYKGPDFTKEMHVFSVLWTQEELVWFVDGVERARSKEGVPHVPMYVVANLGVGGSWPGMPDSETVFPGAMEIDYIRCWKKD